VGNQPKGIAQSASSRRVIMLIWSFDSLVLAFGTPLSFATFTSAEKENPMFGKDARAPVTIVGSQPMMWARCSDGAVAKRLM